jgi:hypothetical protein
VSSSPPFSIFRVQARPEEPVMLDRCIKGRTRRGSLRFHESPSFPPLRRWISLRVATQFSLQCLQFHVPLARVSTCRRVHLRPTSASPTCTTPSMKTLNWTSPLRDPNREETTSSHSRPRQPQRGARYHPLRTQLSAIISRHTPLQRQAWRAILYRNSPGATGCVASTRSVLIPRLANLAPSTATSMTNSLA